jgi:hypothetical protein
MSLVISTIQIMASLVERQVTIGDQEVRSHNRVAQAQVMVNMILHLDVISGLDCGTSSVTLAMETTDGR